MKLNSITVFLFAALVSAPSAALAVEMTSSGCEAPDGNAVEKVVANLDRASRSITVEMHLCQPIDPSDRQDKSTYSVFFDHTAPFIMDSDRNGDSKRDSKDYCADTSEVVISRRARQRDRDGLGKITPDPDRATDVLTFTIGLDELNAPAGAKQVYIWTDIVRSSGNAAAARFPVKDATSNCAQFGWQAALGLMIEP